LDLVVIFVLVLGCCYSYFIYPILISIFSGRRQKETKMSLGYSLPRITLLITAHNEERRIGNKLSNSLCLDYPKDKLQIIVASDASTDATNSIVDSYAAEGVALVKVEDHKGKENAQFHGIRASFGDIIVFSDVATVIEPDAMARLVRYFDDPQVGAVSSEDRFISTDGKVAGEGAYVKYEMWLRRMESQAAGLVGLSGSFFAARKDICLDDWDIYSPSDFNTALNCARKGIRAVTMPDVFGYYSDLADSSKEYQRKIRTIIRGMTAVARHAEVLNPFKYGFFAFQVFSHKVARWLVPWFMLFLFVASVIFIDSFWVAVIFAMQCAFYVLVLLAWIVPRLRSSALFKIPYFFVQVNLAIAHASVLFLSGKRMYTWKPSKR